MDGLDWIALIVWFLVTFYQPFHVSEKSKSRYNEISQKSRYFAYPPMLLYTILWPVLYALMTTAIFLYWRENHDEKMYDSTIALYIVNLVLNKLWSLFFRFSLNLTAAIDNVAVFVTAVVVTVMFGVQSSWISLALYIPYTLWLVYATVISFFYFFDSESKSERLA